MDYVRKLKSDTSNKVQHLEEDHPNIVRRIRTILYVLFRMLTTVRDEVYPQPPFFHASRREGCLLSRDFYYVLLSSEKRA